MSPCRVSCQLTYNSSISARASIGELMKPPIPQYGAISHKQIIFSDASWQLFDFYCTFNRSVEVAEWLLESCNYSKAPGAGIWRSCLRKTNVGEKVCWRLVGRCLFTPLGAAIYLTSFSRLLRFFCSAVTLATYCDQQLEKKNFRIVFVFLVVRCLVIGVVPPWCRLSAWASAHFASTVPLYLVWPQI